MPLIKTITEEGTTYFNSDNITRIEDVNDKTIIWLSDGVGIETNIPLNELLRLIEEAENGK